MERKATQLIISAFLFQITFILQWNHLLGLVFPPQHHCHHQCWYWCWCLQLLVDQRMHGRWLDSSSWRGCKVLRCRTCTRTTGQAPGPGWKFRCLFPRMRGRWGKSCLRPSRSCSLQKTTVQVVFARPQLVFFRLPLIDPQVFVFPPVFPDVRWNIPFPSQEHLDFTEGSLNVLQLKAINRAGESP